MRRAFLSIATIAILVSQLFASVNSAINVSGMPDINLENKDVTVYSWSEFVPEKVYDWAGFRFEDYYGGNVDTIVATGDYYENLYKLLSAGEMIDASVAEALSFPSLIMRGLVQPWDEYIDFSDPIWKESGALDDIEAMRWNDGHIYNITGDSHVLGVMFYNKRLLDEAGLDDPYELFNDGDWDWDTFYYYLEELTQDIDGDGLTDVYGIVNTGDFPIALFCSTGETPIEFVDGEFINNLSSQTQKDAGDFLYKMMHSNPIVMSTGNPTSTFLSGKAAFIYTNDYRGYIDFGSMWETDGLGVVPFPRYKEDVPQYQAALVDYFYLMNGAENPEGVALLALSLRYDGILNIAPGANNADESLKIDFMNRGFSEEAAQAIVDINNLPHKVIWSRSIPMTDGNIEYKAMVIPWTTLSDQMKGKVDSAIKNATTPIR